MRTLFRRSNTETQNSSCGRHVVNMMASRSLAVISEARRDTVTTPPPTRNVENMMSNDNVLLFVPNLIGYARLMLLAASWVYFSDCSMFLCLYMTSVLLDGLDGIAARKLNQVSAFGAWLDVTIDNLGRGMLWTLLYQWGYFISVVEWLVFVCTHSMGAGWKGSVHSNPPSWVQAVMANGFKTPAGTFAIMGLHVLPVWLYGQQMGVWEGWISHHVGHTITGVLVSGRALCMAVELWFVVAHIQNMVAEHKQVVHDGNNAQGNTS